MLRALLTPSSPVNVHGNAPEPPCDVRADVEALCGVDATAWAAQMATGCGDDALPELVAVCVALRVHDVRALPASVVAAAESAVRTHVERGFDLGRGLGLVRLAQGHITRELLAACGRIEDPHARVAAVTSVSSLVFEAADELSLLVSDQHAAERERWLAGPVAEQRAVVTSIVRGEPVDVGRAVRKLGYDLRQQHVGLVLWADEPCPAELHRTASRVLSRLGCQSTLLVPMGGSRLWAWGARPSGDVEGLLLAANPAVHVAVGLPDCGLSGFRVSHEQAVAAAELGSRSTGRVHCYRNLELAALLARDERAAADFVRRELGALAEDSPSAQALRATLKCYLDHDRSVATVAARMHVAKNTVLYRIKRAEQVRGRPLCDNRLQLHTALYLAETFGVSTSDVPVAHTA